MARCSAGCCFAGGGPLRSLLLRRGRATPQVVAPRVAGRNVRSIFTLIVIFLAQPALGSQASVPGCFFCANDLCLLAFSFWRPSQRLLRSGKLFRSDFRFAPSLQQRPRPATSSRWLSAAAPPAGNKPHLAEIRRWRRQSVQMGREICVCLSSNSLWQQGRMRTYIIRCGKGRIPMLRVSKSGPDAPDC